MGGALGGCAPGDAAGGREPADDGAGGDDCCSYGAVNGEKRPMEVSMALTALATSQSAPSSFLCVAANPSICAECVGDWDVLGMLARAQVPSH